MALGLGDVCYFFQIVKSNRLDVLIGGGQCKQKTDDILIQCQNMCQVLPIFTRNIDLHSLKKKEKKLFS